MYCTHCGKNIDDTSKFCSFCGKSVPSRYRDTDDSGPSSWEGETSQWEEQNDYAPKSDKAERTKLDPGIIVLIVATLLHVLYVILHFVSPALSKVSTEAWEIMLAIILFGLLIWAVAYNAQFKKSYMFPAIAVAPAAVQIVIWLACFFGIFTQNKQDIIIVGVIGVIALNAIILYICWKKLFEITSGNKKQAALATTAQAITPISVAIIVAVIGMIVIYILIMSFIIKAVFMRRYWR